MRKIERELCAAILAKRNFCKSNTQLIWNDNKSLGRVYLFGNCIAEIMPDKVHLMNKGWFSSTTKSRLNAIIQCLDVGRGIYQEKWQWYFAGYGYTRKFDGGLTLEYWRSPWKKYEQNEYLRATELGYSDCFRHDGQLWGFPPNGVMPVPVVK